MWSTLRRRRLEEHQRPITTAKMYSVSFSYVVRLVAFLFFLTTALGTKDIGYNLESNYRPQNVTDLAYWLYAWTGS